MKNLKNQHMYLLSDAIFVHPDDVALLSFPPWPKIVYNQFGQEVPSNLYHLVTHSEFELNGCFQCGCSSLRSCGYEQRGLLHGWMEISVAIIIF